MIGQPIILDEQKIGQPIISGKLKDRFCLPKRSASRSEPSKEPSRTIKEGGPSARPTRG
jgi:hypothetical protein